MIMKKKKIDISSDINGIKLSSCIMNASGVLCTTEKELKKLIISSSGAIVTKSCTLKPRKGNLEPRYFGWNIGSINSMGLPNLGIDFYLDFLEKINPKKPFFLSISGLSIEENYLLLHKANLSSRISAVELNLSCPNILGKDQVLGYDFNNIPNFLENIFKFYKKPLGVKLPPYFENRHIKKMAFILNKYPIFFVTCINSLPNGLFIDLNKETVVIQPKMGFGGIGGKTIKPFALANIRQFYTYLRKEIPIIGCGGICSGKDIFEHILCGASAVQIGTQFIKEGVSVFDRLRKELVDLLQKKKFPSINKFIGKLNVF
ncbi:dihydroorotate oxidase [Blattabacterium sp. (Blatta orientalis) str. Tarazona]|uniref:dihydroorotate oxidase n=1 Tax=Blattabacterium sp. (Blatta orientalis) TaxID=367806 RepID=UPI0002AD62A8|nr:dihydroorotate oxidase [Blattabacterium sp. (Blatta orientalis)]AGD98389.1 dihydroorotate oxidase [Blattabacterium sp. (Blatta orientalis) str. Tarazona]